MKENISKLGWGFALAAVIAFLAPADAEAASATTPVQASFTQAPRLSQIQATPSPIATGTKTVSLPADTGDTAARHELVVGGQSMTASLTETARESSNSVTVFHYDYN